jgi:DNA-directed RNA polymerase specialized sigma24 family protein
MGSVGSLSASRFALRAPWRRGAWTPPEAATVLQARRGELVREMGRRRDAVGVPAGVREEIVDEAICAVVMMRRPLVSERHLLGAFWVMARVLLARYRQGRRDLRLGSRRRVPLDEAEIAAEGLAPEEVVELADSAWRAADLMAQLSEIEARVVLVKATRGIGAKAAARELGLPAKDARAAARSAQGKVEMVAAIAAAGRMCEYREGAWWRTRGGRRSVSRRVSRGRICGRAGRAGWSIGGCGVRCAAGIGSAARRRCSCPCRLLAVGMGGGWSGSRVGSRRVTSRRAGSVSGLRRPRVRRVVWVS